MMNKLTSIYLLIISFLSVNQFSQAGCHIDDWKALKALYDNTNGQNWINSTGWDIINNYNSPPDNCDLNTLYGVTTDNGRITCIDLDGKVDCVHSYNDGNNLDGILPPEIGKLNYLKQLVLANNNFEGSIPEELGDLNNLISCNLHNNGFTGSIPPEIGKLTNLEFLALSENGLDGNIPVELYSLIKLKELYLKKNGLTGTISPEIKNLTKIENLQLWSNALTGNLPVELCDLTNLNTLQIHHNDFTGCYPDCFNQFCGIASNFDIGYENEFDADWEDFCAIGAGGCNCPEVATGQAILPTNYSGEVQVEVTFQDGQYVLKNDVATVYDYGTCSDYTDCNPVNVCNNNLAANEAFWVVTEAYEYFSTYIGEEIPPVTIVVNYEEGGDPNIMKYTKASKTIFLGKGDDTKRGSMSAADILGHELTHHVISSIGRSDNYSELGALQESFSDIFGEMIEYYCKDSIDWLFGSDAFIPTDSIPIGIRSLKNPLETGQPIYYKGENWSEEIEGCDFDDHCGIHTNSGVENHWFYLLSEGGEGINESGLEYCIEGIGKEKAAQIAFENLKRVSDPNNTIITHYQAMQGAIEIADSISIADNNPDIAIQNRNAWQAVGLYDTIVNPITWKVANQMRTGPRIDIEDTIIIPMRFDLVIDSLGESLTANRLTVSLQLQEGLRIESIDSIKAILPLLQTEIEESELREGEVIISINRSANQLVKRDKAPNIPSGTPILSARVCIVALDVTGGETDYKIDISGGTTTLNSFIPFEPTNLELAPDGDDTGDSAFSLNLAIGLNQKTCSNLGWIDVDVLNGIPPFTYTLKNNEIDKGGVTKQIGHHIFYGLEEGNYELIIEESGNRVNGKRKTTKSIKIWHRANSNGSECCPSNLVIPPGEYQGLFKASQSIEFSNGTIINEGEFTNICEE